MSDIRQQYAPITSLVVTTDGKCPDGYIAVETLLEAPMLRDLLRCEQAETDYLCSRLVETTAALESVLAEREAAWAVAEAASLWDVCDEAEDDMAAIEAIDELKEVLRPWRELPAAKNAAIKFL